MNVFFSKVMLCFFHFFATELHTRSVSHGLNNKAARIDNRTDIGVENLRSWQTIW